MNQLTVNAGHSPSLGLFLTVCKGDDILILVGGHRKELGSDPSDNSLEVFGRGRQPLGTLTNSRHGLQGTLFNGREKVYHIEYLSRQKMDVLVKDVNDQEVASGRVNDPKDPWVLEVKPDHDPTLLLACIFAVNILPLHEAAASGGRMRSGVSPTVIAMEHFIKASPMASALMPSRSPISSPQSNHQIGEELSPTSALMSAKFVRMNTDYGNKAHSSSFVFSREKF